MKQFLLILGLLMTASFSWSQTIYTASEDGAWCWFSDPRAIYVGESDKIVTGWVTHKGDIEAATIDLNKHSVDTKMLFENMEIDDHNNPAFVELGNQNLLTMYAWHGGKNGVVQHRSTSPESVLSFEEKDIFHPRSEALINTYVKESYTYANPMVLSEEGNKVYAFGRWIGYKPNMITSDDHGATWSEPQVVITSRQLDTNNRPYVKYFSDGKSKIHLIFTDGHPAVEPLNSVYYCYYENGAFWRADQTKICDVEDLPFHPDQASVVYQATEETGRAWIFDVVTDDKDRPVIAYSRYPRIKSHNYHYAVYDNGQWVDHKIIFSGPWFPEDVHGERQRELNYSGGLTLDPSDPSKIYFSHMVDGVFEISSGKTKNMGAKWKFKAITKNSKWDNVRPFVPRYRKPGQKNVVLWMENEKYIHYTNYFTRIKYCEIK